MPRGSTPRLVDDDCPACLAELADDLDRVLLLRSAAALPLSRLRHRPRGPAVRDVRRARPRDPERDFALYYDEG